MQKLLESPISAYGMKIWNWIENLQVDATSATDDYFRFQTETEHANTEV